MSSLIVEVCRVDAVEKHPNADRMEICKVKGWRVCTALGQFKPGDLCVYFPPDTVVPPELSDRLGVTRYLTPLAKNAEGLRPPGGRIRVARLRGEPSYGLIMRCEDPRWEVGTNVAETYGAQKWEPPIVSVDGDADQPHPAFHRYTDIESIRNFPDLFQEGEEVVITEKIHGKNARLGRIRVDDSSGASSWQFMAGSHSLRLKERDAQGRRSQFWECLTESIRALLTRLGGDQSNAILFGEIYGSKVQDLTYGFENGRFAYRAFDIAVDGKYLDFDEKTRWFEQSGLDAVPVLYRGPFSMAKVEEFASGPTTLCPAEKAGRFKDREGIVISPVKERRVAAAARVFDRLILKCINFDYMARKEGTEHH